MLKLQQVANIFSVLLFFVSTICILTVLKFSVLKLLNVSKSLSLLHLQRNQLIEPKTTEIKELNNTQTFRKA